MNHISAYCSVLNRMFATRPLLQVPSNFLGCVVQGWIIEVWPQANVCSKWILNSNLILDSLMNNNPAYVIF